MHLVLKYLRMCAVWSENSCSWSCYFNSFYEYCWVDAEFRCQKIQQKVYLSECQLSLSFCPCHCVWPLCMPVASELAKLTVTYGCKQFDFLQNNLSRKK